MFVSNVLFADGVIDSSKNSKEQDLIAKLTNGKYSEKSDGVKELSEAEMSKVVGGYVLSTPKIIQNQVFGNAIIKEAVSLIEISNTEKLNRVICSVGVSNCSNSYINKNNFNDIALLADINKGEFVGVSVINTTTNVNYIFGNFSKPNYTTNIAVYRYNNGNLEKVRNISTNNHIIYDALNRQKNILVNAVR